MPDSTTSFSTIYDSFLDRVTSDMYMELTEQDTYKQLQGLLVNSIPRFEFPKFDLFNYELGELVEVPSEIEGEEPSTEWVGGFFNTKLNQEEINILSLNMVIEWLGQQLATTENTKLKYSGTDFKFTSQANHMAKLKVMIDTYQKDSLHLQRLYSRRIRTEDGMRSAMSKLMTTPDYGYKI